MQTALLALVALACPVGMGVMMWFMGKGMKRDSAPAQAEAPPNVEDLRAEQARLAAEIERLEDKESAASPFAGARS